MLLILSLCSLGKLIGRETDSLGGIKRNMFGIPNKIKNKNKLLMWKGFAKEIVCLCFLPFFPLLYSAGQKFRTFNAMDFL